MKKWTKFRKKSKTWTRRTWLTDAVCKRCWWTSATTSKRDVPRRQCCLFAGVRWMKYPLLVVKSSPTLLRAWHQNFSLRLKKQLWFPWQSSLLYHFFPPVTTLNIDSKTFCSSVCIWRPINKSNPCRVFLRLVPGSPDVVKGLNTLSTWALQNGLLAGKQVKCGKHKYVRSLKKKSFLDLRKALVE